MALGVMSAVSVTEGDGIWRRSGFACAVTGPPPTPRRHGGTATAPTRKDCQSVSTDTLRDRIAVVLAGHHTDCDGSFLQCECDARWRSIHAWADHVADAVIRELRD